LTAITPYIIVRPRGAVHRVSEKCIRRRGADEDAGARRLIMHAEVAIGNGAIEVSDGNEQYRPRREQSTCMWMTLTPRTPVPCKPAPLPSTRRPTTILQAIAGALSKTPSANHWYIAKPRGWTPGPEGLRSVQPYLHLREAHKMIPFMETVFGRKRWACHKSPEGIVHHATIRIGNATLEIDESARRAVAIGRVRCASIDVAPASIARALRCVRIRYVHMQVAGMRLEFGVRFVNFQRGVSDADGRVVHDAFRRFVHAQRLPPEHRLHNGIILCACRRCRYGCTERSPSGPGVHPRGLAMYQ